MKNIINVKPSLDIITGRLAINCSYVEKEDYKNKDILDIGCGYGWFELNALKEGCKKIYATEITKTDLYTAKNNISDNRVEFIEAGALDIPLKDNSIDTVVCWEVIEHIPKNTENVMFKEVFRVLKPGGRFYISTPNDNILINFFDPLYLFGHRHYTLSELEDFGIKNGFKILKKDNLGNFWSTLFLLNLYVAKWIFRRDLFFKKFFVKKDDDGYSKKGLLSSFICYQK